MGFFSGTKKQSDKTVSAGSENPYLAARREWNERYGSYIARARTWQIVAMCSLGLAAALGAALMYVAGQAKVQPFVVQVDKLGEAVAVHPADRATTPDDRIIRFQLANFISNARSITPDAMVQKRWLDGIYAVAGQGAATYLNEYYKKNDPFATSKTSMVTVDIQTVLPLSPTSWQVQWTETRRNLNGLVEGSSRWQSIITIRIVTPSTAAQIQANPTGVSVDQLSWTQQL